MKPRLHPANSLTIAFFAMLISTTATAESPPDSLSFALQLSRLNISLHEGQHSINTPAKHLGIVSFDTSGQTLQPGLAVGYAYISDSSQSYTAGMELQGYYLAPALRGVLIDGQRLSATLSGTYLYQRVKDNNSQQAVSLEWHQPQLDLEVTCRISRQISLLLGGQYGRIDVDEKITNGVDQTITLKSEAILGYRAGLEFDLGGDAQVGMRLHRAIGDGVELYFQRQY